MFILKVSSPASLHIKCFLFGFTAFLQPHHWAFHLLERWESYYSRISTHCCSKKYFFDNLYTYLLIFNSYSSQFGSGYNQLSMSKPRCPAAISANVHQNHLGMVIKMPISGPYPKSNESKFQEWGLGICIHNKLYPEVAEVSELLLSGLSLTMATS